MIEAKLEYEIYNGAGADTNATTQKKIYGLKSQATAFSALASHAVEKANAADVIFDAVDQIAEAIYQNFMAEITFTLKVAPNNPDLDPGMLALDIYDETGTEQIETVSDGSSVELKKGKYILKCQDPYTYLFMDGKDSKGPVVYTASKTDTQMFQSAMQEVEFAFNDPDGNFPNVTLTPVGGEGEEVTVYQGPNTIRKGTYEMRATLDGYRDLVRQQPISSMTKKVQIQMMKAPAAAGGAM